MKRMLLFFVFSATLLTVSAQKLYELDDLRAGWAKKTITGVQNGNIIALLTAFNKAWPTAPGTAILKDGENPDAQDNEYHFEIDKPNGYVSAGELGDYGQDLAACVWRRSNGHRLFAVDYCQSVGVFPQSSVFFYDYDAAKGTLTPEPNALTRFEPSFPVGEQSDAVLFQLPKVGKDVVVNEYMTYWGFSIKHHYKWNGMSPQWTSTTIEHFDEMQDMYNSWYQGGEEIEFTKFGLIDFDEDHNPELWLFSDNEEYQAIFAIRSEKIKMVGKTYYKTQFSFFPDASAICYSGGCGTGCMRADYTVLKGSQPLYTFADQQDWNNQEDTYESTYFKDEVEISKAEGERIMERFTEPTEIVPFKHPLQP